MLTFTYTARNPATGEKVKAEVQADSEQAAAKLIHQEGLAPIDIKAKESTQKGFGKIKNRIRAKDKVLFSRQLSTLINAGLPLIQALRNVAKQTQNSALETVVSQLINDVEAGMTLSKAMDKHSNVFDQVYVNMIAAGETSGTLDKSLERLADQQEKDAELMSKVRGAMVYPVIVILVMLGVVIFMIVSVLPQVEQLYAGLPGAQLPLVTRVLLAISSFVINFWWVVLLCIGLIAFFTSRWVKTLGGKSLVDRLKMKIWPISPLFMKMYMARFARTGTTLIASGVPLIQMLEITAKSINNVHVEKSLRNAIEKVRGGKSLSDSLKDDGNFLPLVPDMLSIGEQSGSIEEMMSKVADYYEKEVDNQVKAISTIIEPVLMVILGIFAFIIVAAILLPIYGLAGQGVIR
ncbi:MAG: type II secretion system F family protein [Candidatus Saccharibacteria bacterium]|nr:type II secretion system F family protein [Candidatus Saccharibacteria bacterium]